MLRTQLIKLGRMPVRSFSVAAVRSADGDLGSTRSGGGGDSFNKREQASENMYVREKEREALKKLKEKLAAQRKHLDDLDQHIAEMESERGGEQH